MLKFCGLRRREDIEAFNHSPGDYLGFVFARSRRQVTGEEAASLRTYLKVEGVKTVGVFADQTVEEVLDLAARSGVDILQLHGSETDEMLLELKARSGLEIWKAIPCTEEALASFNGIPADKILIDSARGGGSGTLADWDLIDRYRKGFEKPWFLAGGLDAGNIREAMERLEPCGVDVSSGIECGGFKDPFRMEEIARKVREHGQEDGR